MTCNWDGRPRWSARRCQFLNRHTPSRKSPSTSASAPKTRMTEKLTSGSAGLMGGAFVEKSVEAKAGDAKLNSAAVKTITQAGRAMTFRVVIECLASTLDPKG